MPAPRAIQAQQLPSLASVFGQQIGSPPSSELQDNSIVAPQCEALSTRPASSDDDSQCLSGPSNFHAFHQPRRSTSTSNSDDSTDSSPTTTVSTLDSSSMTETSPSAATESPASTLSPASVVSDHWKLRRAETDHVFTSPGQQSTYDAATRPGLLTKKGRNLKNLAVNTSQAYSLGKAISTAQFPLGQTTEEPKTERTSAPASPAFIKPPTPPRRKQANVNLSILTPGPGQSLPALTIPPTPSAKRPTTLRHFQSSPSLPLVTPSLLPVGGMELPPTRVRPPPRGFAEVPMEDEEDEAEPDFDIPQSREDKPEAYPDGPIAIYESGVDLYLEPTADIARRYDVVLNVASEVKNPFVEPSVAGGLPQLSNQIGVLSDDSRQQQNNSPTTPKATPIVSNAPSDIAFSGSGQPEYIHIPWEHNTDIVPDLHRLVKVIDDRVQQGKRVLVHCQCGVSRSASLIVAYGLYKNPELSVQEAYDAVKRRSKWIGPNMNLIMQLQEFKAGLRRHTTGNPYMFGFPRQLSSAINPNVASVEPLQPHTPRTAPLQADTASLRASTGNIPMTASAVQRGPSPAFFDSGFRRSWDSGRSSYEASPALPARSTAAYVDTKGQVLPVMQSASEDSTTPQEEHTSPAQLNRLGQSSIRSSVPNFSRQLPFRVEHEDDVEMSGSSMDDRLTSSSRTVEVVPTVAAPRPENNFNMFAPRGLDPSKPTKLDLRPLPPKPLLLQSSADPAASLLSPRSEQFAMTPFSTTRSQDEDTFGLFSPMSTSFPTELPSQETAPLSTQYQSSPPISSVELEGLTSPRSETFGMVGYSHLQGGDDSFGLMSPVKTTFGGDPWSSIFAKSGQETRLPHRERSQTPQQSDYERRPSTPPALTDASSPDLGATPSPPPPTTQHLDATSRPLKGKFSSPALAEQRRLQQIQTHIESQLPHATGVGAGASSDADALLSPRATEFTVNPFHVDPAQQQEDGEGVQPLPTILPAGQQSSSTDPRSPAQLGISPITRNIFDVL